MYEKVQELHSAQEQNLWYMGYRYWGRIIGFWIF